jgi:hypothetical protein
MNAQFKERPVDPEVLEAESWDDLGSEEKRECLEITLLANPELLEKFYSEALSAGVDPFDYWSEVS